MVSVTLVLEPEMYIPPPDCERRKALAFGRFQASLSIGAMEGSMVAFERLRARTPCPSSVRSVIEA